MQAAPSRAKIGGNDHLADIRALHQMLNRLELVACFLQHLKPCIIREDRQILQRPSLVLLIIVPGSASPTKCPSAQVTIYFGPSK